MVSYYVIWQIVILYDLERSKKKSLVIIDVNERQYCELFDFTCFPSVAKENDKTNKNINRKILPCMKWFDSLSSSVILSFPGTV